MQKTKTVLRTLRPFKLKNYHESKGLSNFSYLHTLDLPKSSWKKGIDDLSQAAHSWITQQDGQMVFGTAETWCWLCTLTTTTFIKFAKIRNY